jgi:putative ABC transport system permease protein
MEQLGQDLRFALRSFIKNPGFLVVAVVTLALGIGANTAIFSIVNAVLLRPLPYPEPERLVTFGSNQSFLDQLDVQAQTETLESLGGIALAPMDFTGGAQPVQAMTGLTTPDFFRTLGARAELGRLIDPSENRPGGERLVVLSHKFWKEQLNSDPKVTGKQLPFGGDSYAVVGVLPASFRPPREAPDAYVSLSVGYPAAAQARGVHFLRAYGRLKPGISLAQAQAEMTVIDRRLAAIDPGENKMRRSVLIPLQERVVGESRQTLLILFGAVGLVLLVACANFANLLLSRSAAREQEMVVRAALGARRWRMIRQLLTESVAIALVGGVIGTILAVWGLELLVSLKPANLPRLEDIHLDPWMLAFTFVVSLLTGIVFGLVPAWQSARVDVASALKEGGRSATAGAARHRLRSTIVVAEIAMAIVLLMGAGLLIRSLWNLRSVAPGFDAENVVSMRIDLPEARYREIPQQTRYREQILSSLNSVTGIEAAIISEVPLGGSSLHHDFLIDGRPPVAPGDEPSLYSRSVMGNYFGVMRIPIRAGRDFNAKDGEGRPLVGIVNEEMVRTYFPNEDPIGKRVRWARATNATEWIEIVGVAADVKHFGLDQPEAPALYWPYAQSRQPWKRWSQVVVRTVSAPETMIPSIKTQIWSVDPKVSINNLSTMSSLTADSYAERSFNMILLSIFSAIALTLAAVGIYGVIAYAVSQRTHEIGIRMALGAQTSDVLRLIGRQGLILVGVGIVIGIGSALALTRVMTGLLYRVSAADPRTFIGIIVLVAVVALLACYLPARRATRVDPMEALRAL